MNKKGYWLNTTIVRKPDLPKPCAKLQYCPYGQLVEEYPLSYNEKTKTYPKVSCAMVNGAIIPFGHDCPVHYLAEFVDNPTPIKKARKAGFGNDLIPDLSID
jgi:hypothetical protein